ncbi:hypothetical protein [Aquimarina sp. MMG016]|uniref:hypothetical protein n=1 Tax=Aquimarina sp. MMG016 TaxID=2822690 RepID=UPI001B3A1024|nr:hypothetical protein [Aquimarina sp. MMG016]MBQ4819381.1 hypothetical protein [Aquimarina sp. MMG016]
MELEEMQAVWADLSSQLEKQKKLTDKMIIMMTQEKYKKKWNRIAYPEILGTIICYGVAILILINIGKLDNWYTLLSGLISVVVLLILPVLSLRSIFRMRKLNIAENDYKDTLMQYAKGKKRFQSSMKLGYYLGFILMFAIMPVTTKLLNNKDLFTETTKIWPFLISIPLAVVFMIFFSKWVYKSYNRNIIEAENLIKDLEE